MEQETSSERQTQTFRIVTRPDFDGIVCAVLLKNALGITGPVVWVEPSEIQSGLVRIQNSDILANLPYQPGCALWFDHHVSNVVDVSFEGMFEVAPSAAGLVYRYFKDRFSRDFEKLVMETDRIDSADLRSEEVLQPEINPYLMLSMTTDGGDPEDLPYWERIIDILGSGDIHDAMGDSQVQQRCRQTLEQNRKYKKLLLAHTSICSHVAVTDFRTLSFDPRGNRFLVYSLFPEASVHIKIRYVEGEDDRLGVSIGHSIFNRTCRVNIGLMLTEFGGGGHRGAGGCRFPADLAEEYLPRMIDILLQNKPHEIE
jgi:nanoRNase/pAp phosphatase (c-di-AMP/oligoRNAs hydrolase)